MGASSLLLVDLRKVLGGWNFLSVNLVGLSGAIITKSNDFVALLNSFSLSSGLCIEF